LADPSDRDLAWLGWRRRAESWSAVTFGKSRAEAADQLAATLASEEFTGPAAVFRRGQTPDRLPAGARVEWWGFGLRRDDRLYEQWAERRGVVGGGAR
jgi:hypothetical protein